MSSKQDAIYEKKIAEEAALGENANDMGKIINVKALPIQFPNETWEEIVMWCNRLELGEHVSLVNDRLFCISYTFMHEEKEHILPELKIYGGNKKVWMEIRCVNGYIKSLAKKDVPSVEISDNIIAGNKYLNIRGLCNGATNFIQLLIPIYSAIFLILDVKKEELSKAELKELMQLFEGKVHGLIIGGKTTFSEFHKHFETLMKDLVLIRICHEFTEQDFIVLKNWLYQARDDGKPKVVYFSNLAFRGIVQTIKEDFLNANQKAPFVLRSGLGSISAGGLPCNIVNSSTKERLTIQSYEGPSVWLFARLPQDCSESSRAFSVNAWVSVRRLPLMRIEL